MLRLTVALAIPIVLASLPGCNRHAPEHGRRAQFPHDILTGSNPDGTLADGDMTCRNWKSTTGYAMFGHSDRQGGRGNANSWNSAHQSEGCTTAAFRETGGSGLFYCFAID